MDNRIELKSIKELLGMKFFIPNYQRGYRWTEQQVKDLLNDINEFNPISKCDSDEESWYCLQPLVVRKMDKKDYRLNEVDNNTDWYEVIDGQQRLTTLSLIIQYFNEMWVGKSKIVLPRIMYETRKDSFSFLTSLEILDSKAVSTRDFNDTIDYHFMLQAYEVIHEWASEKEKRSDFDTNKFQSKVISSTRFIWYESVDEDPIKVFTRLNIGKIPLTNSELIKALFLNRTNFNINDEGHVRLRQQEIASEWDRIEYTLQNEEFWLFLHETGYNRPTRIDFIFDLICGQHALGEFENIGNDHYNTFRYFYEYFKMPHDGNDQKSGLKIEKCWAKVKKYFQTFQEWYNDLELYHYVGYLIAYNQPLSSLVEEWNKNAGKETFVSYLKKQIKDKISKCPSLDFQYKEDGSDKGKCKPILLFNNIQTVINQNSKNKDAYGLGMFYKFPFHLYKKESWDVEHINSNTTNPENDETTQKEWLMNVYLVVNEDVQGKIRSYFNNQSVPYEELKGDIPSVDNWTPKEKNRIWNYALLDSSTNRSYGNAIFSGKRRVIIGKDQGKLLAIPKLKRGGDGLEIAEEKDAASSFVPPCTKQIFMKYYSASLSDFNYWDKDTDAPAYLKDIEKCIKQLEENSNEQ